LTCPSISGVLRVLGLAERTASSSSWAGCVIGALLEVTGKTRAKLQARAMDFRSSPFAGSSPSLGDLGHTPGRDRCA